MLPIPTGPVLSFSPPQLSDKACLQAKNVSSNCDNCHVLRLKFVKFLTLFLKSLKNKLQQNGVNCR